MRKEILSRLSEIEKVNNVKILYACESGSRAWGFHSVDSDYDVRFIYVRPLKDYLRTFDVSDVIEIPISDNLDISGWDLKKALRLLYKSNPSLMEWINSKEIYFKDDEFHNALLKISKDYYSKFSCKYHYYGMAYGNNDKYLSGKKVNLKKYLYVLRPLVAVEWIDTFDEMPPTNFLEAVSGLQFADEFKSSLSRLLLAKINGMELTSGDRLKDLDDFILTSLSKFEIFKQSFSYRVPTAVENLDGVFYSTVLNFNDMQVNRLG